MMKRLVNGVEVLLSPSEEAAVLAERAAAAAAPPPVPNMVPKLALIRAWRKIKVDGTPAVQGQPTAWDAAKAAIAAAGGTVAEDWEFASDVPRNSPSLLAMAAALVGAQTAPALLDASFILAGQIDRGEVAP